MPLNFVLGFFFGLAFYIVRLSTIGTITYVKWGIVF